MSSPTRDVVVNVECGDDIDVEDNDSEPESPSSDDYKEWKPGRDKSNNLGTVRYAPGFEGPHVPASVENATETEQLEEDDDVLESHESANEQKFGGHSLEPTTSPSTMQPSMSDHGPVDVVNDEKKDKSAISKPDDSKGTANEDSNGDAISDSANDDLDADTTTLTNKDIDDAVDAGNDDTDNEMDEDVSNNLLFVLWIVGMAVIALFSCGIATILMRGRRKQTVDEQLLTVS